MEINLDNYYKRFGSEVSHEDYKYLLFRSGDILQSSEMNDLQGILKTQLNTLTSGFHTNGSVVSGVEINIEKVENGTNGLGDTLYDLTINYSEGILFVEGEFISIDAGSVSKAGQTEEGSDFKLGIAVVAEIISAFDDTVLLDPGLETRNQGQPGANRLKKTATLGVIENDGFFDLVDVNWYELYRIKNLDIYFEPDTYVTDVEKKIVKLSAEYDERTNGNYLLSGYETSYIGTTDPISGTVGDNLGLFWFSIANGSANIGGYNYETFNSLIFSLNKLIDFELHQNEPITFNGDGWYEVRHTPLRKVFRVTGERELLGFALTHGSFSGAEDEVPSQYQPIRSVSRVFQGTTTFVAGSDYAVTGDSIDWLLGADNEPAPNSTYFIDFKYQYTENDGSFSIDGANSMGQISPDLTQIYLYGFSDGSIIQYDYDFILERRDVIALNSKGNLVSVKGNPAETNPREPEIDNDNLLKIASVILRGNQDPEIFIDSNRTFKMSDIQLILDSLKENQYNINRIALELDLFNKQPGANFKSQFVEDFISDDHRDAGLTQTALTIGGNLIMGIDWETILPEPLYYPTLEDGEENFSIEYLPTPPISSVLEQPFHTGSSKINRYLRIEPPRARITLIPRVYRWIDKEVYRTISTREDITQNIRRRRWGWWWWGWWGARRISRTTLSSVTTSSSTASSVSDSSERSIIPNNVVVRINSNPGAFNDNEEVEIRMDGIPVQNRLVSPSGTLISNFTIPDGTVSGHKFVTVEGLESGAQGSSGFLAQPQTKTFTTTITETWRWIRRTTIWGGWWWWWRPRPPVRVDPLSQTFEAPKNMTVDSIEVIFSESSLTDVEMFVVEVENGYPNSDKILCQQRIFVDDLEPAGTRQRFRFKDPAYLVEGTHYAFILLNGDSVAEIQIATMGEKTLEAPIKWLTDPAYQTGVMFTSANNSAWTAHQLSDIQFWLYERHFNPSRNLFYEFLVEDATDLMVASGSKVLENTSVTYKVTLYERSIDQNNTLPVFFEVSEYEQFPLEEKFTGRVTVEVLLKTEDSGVTPTLEADVQLGVGYTSRISEYTSVGFEISSSDGNAVAYMDIFEPDNTGIKVYLQIVDPETKNIYWEEMVRDNHQEILDENWSEAKFELDLKPSGVSIVDIDQTITRVKIEMETDNDKDRPVTANLRLSINKI